MPEHEAKYYDKEFEAGRTIVTVTADGQADKATAILRRYGAYDVSNRSAQAEATHTAVRSTGAGRTRLRSKRRAARATLFR